MTNPSTGQGVSLLKELLFERESRRLDDLARRLETDAAAATARDKTLSDRLDIVFERTGTEDSLLRSVAAIIDGALREAEIARHEPLSRAIAPLIVRTIKIQLRDSQDEMVDALYPITGRLVKSYVQAEINKRMIEINAKLGGARPAALAARSTATGVSMGDLALAEANKLEVDEVFLVRRGSGDLIAHWEKPAPDIVPRGTQRAGGSNRDVLISGYISGIMTFSEEAFGATPGSFRTLELEGGERIFVRGSTAHLLAVRCRGSAGASVEQIIDEIFLDTLERYQQVLAADNVRRRTDGSHAGTGTPESQTATRSEIAAILPAVSRSIELKMAERQAALGPGDTAAGPASTPSFARLYVLAAALATPILLWGAWSAYQSFETIRTESAANRVLETTDEITGLPPKIDVARGGGSLIISGFVPSAALRDQILTRLGQEVPQASVRNQLTVFPQSPNAVADALAQLRRDIEQQRQDATDAAITRALSRIRQRLQALQAVIAKQEQVNRTGGAQPSSELNELGKSLATALDQQQSWLTSGTIDQRQLETLWQTLTRAEGQLSTVMGATSVAPRPADPKFGDRVDIAEDASLIAERLAAAGTGLTIPTLTARIDRLRPPTARDVLDTLVRSHAIFFENGIDLRNQKQAAQVLDQLTQSLRENPDVLLRVVGYTDEKGGQALNGSLAQTRADRIVALLAERGIATSRLVAVGRLTIKDLSRNVGTGSANRRVEFEIGFPGETDGAP